MKAYSLLGKSNEEKSRWAARYRDMRKLSRMTVKQLFEAALREQGTHPEVTITKLRKAAARIVREGAAQTRAISRAG
jgi:hypothetical protein